ncbi:hypothetical protein PVAND_013941 [Polypedilum vanderplanki]|uniref:Uncharacterized protein n=1 Tax=Polypedilum vanderplanki TaxID=319348 RepID=A0A9J6CS89_POLVA|nr:hypothetical protein PVAND_013941 [Polypedilum vanderplanki]
MVSGNDLVLRKVEKKPKTLRAPSSAEVKALTFLADFRVGKVTGGANGLGQFICLKLAAEGCHVAIADICSSDETIEKLKKYNVQTKAYEVDVSNFKEVIEFKKKLDEEFGDIDILVNNAGIVSYKSIAEQSFEEIEKLTSVNINSVMFMTKCFLSDMIKRKCGHLVSISSLQGIYAFPCSINYSSTKFAITGFMLAIKEFLRIEKFENIFTTIICPHVIATNKHVVDVVNPKRATILSPEETSKIVVDAIINRSSFVTIPSYFSYFIPLFNSMPFCLQHLIRDIRDETSFLNKL